MEKGVTMGDLAAKQCIPCMGGVPPLPVDEQQRLLRELAAGWRIVDGHHLERVFDYPDFKTALGMTNRVGALAEEQGHHPDFNLAWGKLRLTIWTHKINGLTESDFVLAAKIDRLAS
jgi:4a-hydroxytetrahydrobiopterin dehydratase